ncbi:MAG: hypothetical protein IJ532_06175 [Alphaproteobacteria bacterium]|nr:hypothetical protein [Alphaproteobacteria bacterium]
MKKYLWILGVLFFGGLAAFAFFATDGFRKSGHKSYEPSPLTFIIDWEITKPIVLQVIYIKDKKDVFSQKVSVWKHVNPEDKHVELVIPADRIYNFRVDFKSKPGKMIIKNIEIKGDMYLNFNHWNDYRYANTDKTKVNDDNYLEIYSEQDDPHMVFLYPFVLDEKKAKSDDKIIKYDDKKAASVRKAVPVKRKAEPDEKKIAPDGNKTTAGEDKVAADKKEVIPSEDKVASDEKNITSDSNEAAADEQVIVSNSSIKPIIPAKKPIYPRRKFR